MTRTPHHRIWSWLLPFSLSMMLVAGCSGDEQTAPTDEAARTVQDAWTTHTQAFVARHQIQLGTALGYSPAPIEGRDLYATAWFAKLDRLLTNKGSQLLTQGDAYNWIQALQQPDGSFKDSNPSRTLTPLYVSYLAAEAAQNNGVTLAGKDKLVSYVASLQGADGLFAWERGGATSVEATQVALQTMQATGHDLSTLTRVQDALQTKYQDRRARKVKLLDEPDYLSHVTALVRIGKLSDEDRSYIALLVQDALDKFELQTGDVLALERLDLMTECLQLLGKKPEVSPQVRQMLQSILAGGGISAEGQIGGLVEPQLTARMYVVADRLSLPSGSEQDAMRRVLSHYRQPDGFAFPSMRDPRAESTLYALRILKQTQDPRLKETLLPGILNFGAAYASSGQQLPARELYYLKLLAQELQVNLDLPLPTPTEEEQKEPLSLYYYVKLAQLLNKPIGTEVKQAVAGTLTKTPEELQKLAGEYNLLNFYRLTELLAAVEPTWYEQHATVLQTIVAQFKRADGGYTITAQSDVSDVFGIKAAVELAERAKFSLSVPNAELKRIVEGLKVTTGGILPSKGQGVTSNLQVTHEALALLQKLNEHR